eukprot:1004067-Prymnesium_polylepis.1
MGGGRRNPNMASTTTDGGGAPRRPPAVEKPTRGQHLTSRVAREESHATPNPPPSLEPGGTPARP